MAIAAAAVNNFKTVTKVVGISTQEAYRAPVGYVGVFLLAQCSNIGSNVETLSLYHNRNEPGIGTVVTEIVRNFSIPGSDTVNLLPGKLVLETDDFITISGSSDTNLKFITSILETTNQ